MVKVDRFIPQSIEKIKEQISGPAIIALSGGVDSSVCAVLAHRAIGELLFPIYIDTGLMRKGETQRIKEIFSDFTFFADTEGYRLEGSNQRGHKCDNRGPAIENSMSGHEKVCSMEMPLTSTTVC